MLYILYILRWMTIIFPREKRIRVHTHIHRRHQQFNFHLLIISVTRNLCPKFDEIRFAGLLPQHETHIMIYSHHIGDTYTG